MPWRDLLLPAAEAADARRCELGRAVRRPRRHPRHPAAHAGGERGVLARGERSREGEPIRQPDLAATIERLAERPGDLYTGELARAMVAHQHATGGPLTMADLAAYRPIWRRPLLVPYGGHVILTNPPPSSGGVLIGHMLSVLEGVPGPRPPGRARTLRAYAETMRAAGRMRTARFTRLLHRGGLGRHMLLGEAVEAGRAAVARGARGRADAGAGGAVGSRHDARLGRRPGRQRLRVHGVERLATQA